MSDKAAAQGDTAGRSGQPIQQASDKQPVPEPDYRHHTPPALILSQNSMQVHKFYGRGQLHLWSHIFQTFLTARGLIWALEPTSDPIRIAGGLGGMEERKPVDLSPWAEESREVREGMGISYGSHARTACGGAHACRWAGGGSVKGCDGLVSATG